MQLISNAPPLKPLFGLLKPFEQQAFSALVFLPNLASPFAREAAIDLNKWIPPLDEVDCQLLSISMTPPALARDAVPRLLLKYPIICDPEGLLFQHFSIGPASLWQCLPTRLPPKGILRSMLEWRQAFRAKGGVIICKQESIISKTPFQKIDSRPKLDPILEIIRSNLD